MISDETLLDLNRKGFIPAPLESRSAFLERVNYCQKLQAEVLEPNTPRAAALLATIAPLVYKKLGFFPDWIPLVFSNKKLLPWHGGCAWFFQKEDKAPLGTFIQMRKKKMFFYTEEEILLHEMVHVGRMSFDEPIFEEMLAYRTSKNSFRRCFGPLFSKSYEVIIFFFSLLIPFFAPLLFFLPISGVVYWLYRLKKRENLVNQTFSLLQGLTRSRDLADHVLYRLSDEEMLTFSQLSLDELILEIKNRKEQSLHERLIYLLLCEKKT